MPSSGVYGTRVPAKISAEDIEIFYSYSPTRSSDDVYNAKFKPLNSSLLTQAVVDGDANNNNGSDNILEGVHNLKLPLQYFNKKGFYTVYIRPKEIPVIISDIGNLTSYPDVKGIVVDTTTVGDSSLQTKFKNNNSLVGYRIEYFNDQGARENYYRLVTSNNKCEPVISNIDSLNKSKNYRYNDSSSLTFITVTPSVGASFKPNATPFIGAVAQKVLFINTKFEPIMIDLEMVENDADTITTLVAGSQLRDLDNGLITTFNNNNEIVRQHEVYSLKSETTGVPQFEVKIDKSSSIDYSQTLDDKL